MVKWEGVALIIKKARTQPSALCAVDILIQKAERFRSSVRAIFIGCIRTVQLWTTKPSTCTAAVNCEHLLANQITFIVLF